MKQLTTLLFLLIVFQNTAQSDARIETLISTEHTLTDQIRPGQTATSTLLPSSFTEKSLKIPQVNLQELTVVKVYYIYTRYKLNEDFDQTELDRQRFMALKKSFQK